jgi:hypothetical protein
MSLTEEAAFWKGKLEEAKHGSAEYDQALRESVRIKEQLDHKSSRGGAAAAKEGHNEVMRALHEESTAAVAGSRARIAAEEQELAMAKKLFGERSAQAHAINERIIADRKAAAQQMIKDDIAADKQQTQVALQQLADEKMIADAKREADRAALRDQVADKKATAAEILAAERKLDSDQLQADTQYYTKKAQLDKGDVKAVLADIAQISVARENARKADLKAETRYHQEIQKQWQHTMQGVAHGVANGLKGMLFQQQSFKSAMLNIAMDIGSDMIDHYIEEPLEKFLMGKTAETAATTSAATAQAAAKEAVRVSDAAADAAASVAGVMRASGVAGAQGTASFAGAPWPIDLGAPAFGASMMGIAASYASVASAAGGWGQVPADTLAQIHKDEMILPADLATGVRSMISMTGGARKSGDTYHIHAMDARSIKESLRRNPSALSSGIKHARKRGHLGM